MSIAEVAAEVGGAAGWPKTDEPAVYWLGLLQHDLSATRSHKSSVLLPLESLDALTQPRYPRRAALPVTVTAWLRRLQGRYSDYVAGLMPRPSLQQVRPREYVAFWLLERPVQGLEIG